jgi:phosphohistidine phosphatase
MRFLLLMRHAKSDWEADYTDDHSRPLNDRGIESAQLMGRVLAARDEVPQVVISSTALRARATAELAMEAGGWRSPLLLDRALYESGPDGVIDVAAGAPDEERLMLVGHQPTWSMLVTQLTGERVEMKTATISVVEFDLDSWATLTGATGTLSHVLHPRSLAGSEWDREP